MQHWTPEGFIGQMFAAMKPFAPPPPPGAQPAPLWGSEDHVRELFGDRLSEIRAQKRTVAITSFRQPEDFLHYFKSHYGPTISVYKSLSGDEEKAKALDNALTELAGNYIEAHGDTTAQMEWEYLLLTAKANAKPQETGL
jgi:hypothetical protein